MNPSRRIIQMGAVGALGLILILVGLSLYEASGAQAARNNGNCPPGALCVTQVPDSLSLVPAFVGVALILIATVVAVYVVRRGHPTPATRG
jgi:hypothetical protein